MIVIDNRPGLTRRQLLWSAAGGLLAAQPTSVSKYLLLDSSLIAAKSGVKLALGEVRKDTHNPLFLEDKAWEPRFDNLYANVVYDEQEKIYKCWYSPFITDQKTTATPRDKRKTVNWHKPPSEVEMGLCYATSRDGLRWEKPELGLVDFNGSKKNNILLRADPQVGEPHGSGVWKDLHDPNPARRYKMFFNRFNRTLQAPDPRRRYMCAGFSPDGIHWRDFHDCLEIEAPGDTHSNWFWAPKLNKYVGITRLSQGQRMVARTESADFLHWTKAEVILKALPSEPKRQTYAMPSFPYANGYLGLVMMLNLNGANDTVDCELTWSADSVHWERICPGTPMIPRGPEGAYDSKCLYGAFRPVVRDGEIRLYYGGNNGEHTDFRDGFFCLARLRPDGFAGYEPETAGGKGSVTTTAVKCEGKRLLVSADAARGSLEVAALDRDGHEFARSERIGADVTDAPVRWREPANLGSLEGKPVQLRFDLASAKVYSFSWV